MQIGLRKLIFKFKIISLTKDSNLFNYVYSLLLEVFSAPATDAVGVHCLISSFSSFLFGAVEVFWCVISYFQIS